MWLLEFETRQAHNKDTALLQKISPHERVRIDELEETVNRASHYMCCNCIQKSQNKDAEDEICHDFQTARANDATSATFHCDDLDYPFAEGGFRFAAKGKYTAGGRAGQPCVLKWFKTGMVFEKEFYDLDMKAIAMAHDLIKQWNDRRYITKCIRLNMPEVWIFNPDSGKWAGTKALVEPFIHNYRKYNSNSGWADAGTPWPRVMQALSHFSYHISDGDFLVCDLQGGEYSNSVVLTDPVILSRNRSFGPTDLGPRGISSFFSNHRCNEFCKSAWKRPADQTRYFPPQTGTSMAGTGVQKHVTRR